jgi:DNA-binding NarL/FixJ family response regulator
VRVALADDSTLFREGLASLLIAAQMQVTVQARTGDELLARVERDVPDVAVVDIRMPPTYTDEGLTTAQQLRDAHPELAVLVLSTFAEPRYAMRLLGFGRGGVGYLLKDSVLDVADLCDSLRRLRAGEVVIEPSLVQRLMQRQSMSRSLDVLSDRELHVLRLMAQGRSNAGICHVLSLSAKTVETHVGNIFTKLDLFPGEDDNRRVLAVLTWLRATGPT